MGRKGQVCQRGGEEKRWLQLEEQDVGRHGRTATSVPGAAE